jgi:hypothetical protein
LKNSFLACSGVAAPAGTDGSVIRVEGVGATIVGGSTRLGAGAGACAIAGSDKAALKTNASAPKRHFLVVLYLERNLNNMKSAITRVVRNITAVNDVLP